MPISYNTMLLIRAKSTIIDVSSKLLHSETVSSNQLQELATAYRLLSLHGQAAMENSEGRVVVEEILSHMALQKKFFESMQQSKYKSIQKLLGATHKKAAKQEWYHNSQSLMFPGRLKFKGVPGGGKQKKAIGTGRFEEIGGKTIFIKRAEQHPSDDMAELFGANVLSAAIGADHVPSATMTNRIDGAVFLKSEGLNKFEELKKSVPSKKMIGSEIWDPAAKKALTDKITRKGLKQDMAQILAGCAFVHERDCQVENIGFYTKADGAPGIAKIDHGWAFAGIMKDKHDIVKLFSKTGRYGRSTSDLRAKPINHLTDYPDILNSMDMVDALNNVAMRMSDDAIQASVEQSVNSVASAYINQAAIQGHSIEDQQLAAMKALKEFARHISFPVKKLTNPLDSESNPVKNANNQLVYALTKKLKSRRASLKLTALFLENKVRNEDKAFLAQNKIKPPGSISI